MAYIMYLCPGCGNYFKTKSSGRKIRCLRCHYEYLLDLQITDEAWRELDHDARQQRIREIKEAEEAPKITAAEVEPAEQETAKEEIPEPGITKDTAEDKHPEEAKHTEEAVKPKEEPEAVTKAGEDATDGGRETGESEESGEEKERKPIERRNILILSIVPAVLIFLLILTSFVIPRFRFNREMNELRAAQAGDVVTYGKYRGNKEWIVLDRQDDNLLCISDYTVSIEHDGWLNSQYINRAFNVYERGRLVPGKSVAGAVDSALGAKVAGKAKVFLLEPDELSKYPVQEVPQDDGGFHPICWIDASAK